MNIFLKAVLISILWMITANTVADDHASDSNPAVAMQVHYCSLKEGKDMASVNKALSTWRKWKKETNYNGWTAELTPMFDIRDNYDFYWLNFAPFDYMAEVLKEYESTGGPSQKAIDSVADCKVAIYGSKLKYPLVEESTLDETNYLSVEFCNRREGVEMQSLLSRHAYFASLSEAGDADYLWNVVWPMAGVPSVANGTDRADFANMLWYTSLGSLMSSLNSEANGDLGMIRREYIQAYADCADRNIFNVNIINKPNRPWR